MPKPFHQNPVLGDMVYTIAVFGGVAIFNRLCQPARQAV